MRKTHSLFRTAIALVAAIAAAASPLAFAQAAPSQASPPAQDNRVFSPSAPTLPLQHPPLTASSDIVTQPGDWKAANAAVAEFPRGHGDVLKWEKAQSPVTKATEQATPAQGHYDHGGQR